MLLLTLLVWFVASFGIEAVPLAEANLNIVKPPSHPIVLFSESTQHSSMPDAKGATSPSEAHHQMSKDEKSASDFLKAMIAELDVDFASEDLISKDFLLTQFIDKLQQFQPDDVQKFQIAWNLQKYGEYPASKPKTSSTARTPTIQRHSNLLLKFTVLVKEMCGEPCWPTYHSYVVVAAQLFSFSSELTTAVCCPK